MKIRLTPGRVLAAAMLVLLMGIAFRQAREHGGGRSDPSTGEVASKSRVSEAREVDPAARDRKVREREKALKSIANIRKIVAAESKLTFFSGALTYGPEIDALSREEATALRDSSAEKVEKILKLLQNDSSPDRVAIFDWILRNMRPDEGEKILLSHLDWIEREPRRERPLSGLVNLLIHRFGLDEDAGEKLLATLQSKRPDLIDRQTQGMLVSGVTHTNASLAFELVDRFGLSADEYTLGSLMGGVPAYSRDEGLAAYHTWMAKQPEGPAKEQAEDWLMTGFARSLGSSGDSQAVEWLEKSATTRRECEVLVRHLRRAEAGTNPGESWLLKRIASEESH